MYDEEHGVPQDYKTAVKWFTLAAPNRGVAQSYLGAMYGNGTGVIQDYVRAHMWWNIAPSSGNEGAVTNTDIIAKLMTPVDISAAQTLARECIRRKYKGC